MPGIVRRQPSIDREAAHRHDAGDAETSRARSRAGPRRPSGSTRARARSPVVGAQLARGPLVQDDRRRRAGGGRAAAPDPASPAASGPERGDQRVRHRAIAPTVSRVASHVSTGVVVSASLCGDGRRSRAAIASGIRPLVDSTMTVRAVAARASRRQAQIRRAAAPSRSASRDRAARTASPAATSSVFTRSVDAEIALQPRRAARRPRAPVPGPARARTRPSDRAPARRATVSRIDRPTSSRRPCSESSGMSVGRAMRTTSASPAAAPSSAARSGLSQRVGSRRRARPSRRETRRSARRRRTRCTLAGAPGRRLVQRDARQRRAAARRWRATRPPRRSAERFGERLSARRRRPTAGRAGSSRSTRRLSRTDAPTSSDPASTATAPATPSDDGDVRAPVVDQARAARGGRTSWDRRQSGGRSARTGDRSAPPAPGCA